MIVTQSGNLNGLTEDMVSHDTLPASSRFRPDEELRQRVQLFLLGSNLPNLRHLAVEVSGDTVILCGHVRTFYEKQLAIGLSRRVAGVIHIVDRIEVESYSPRVEPSGVLAQRRLSQ
jgi:hypothetical protein